MPDMNRRNFIKKSALAATAVGVSINAVNARENSAEPIFKISLAQWSINRSLFSKKIDHLDFPILARKHGIHAIEYVNQFFMDKAKNTAYLQEMKYRADGEGVQSVLIMCDREGNLGDADASKRSAAVDQHKKWVEAAKFLGCHSIRVNGYSTVKWGESDNAFHESQKLVADGLRKLCEFAAPHNIGVIIENHGGFTSHGEWLAGVIKMTDHPGAGTLPDFGNFRIARPQAGGESVSYDAYRGVKELMPFAKGVSVKTTAWDNKGNQSPLNYEKMMKIVLDAGYRGYCGIEHGEEGREWDSILEVKAELERVREKLGKKYTR